MQALSTLIIDRFEGDFAICEREDCTMVTIEKSRLPKGVRPGNILKMERFAWMQRKSFAAGR